MSYGYSQVETIDFASSESNTLLKYNNCAFYLKCQFNYHAVLNKANISIISEMQKIYLFCNLQLRNTNNHMNLSLY